MQNKTKLELPKGSYLVSDGEAQNVQGGENIILTDIMQWIAKTFYPKSIQSN